MNDLDPSEYKKNYDVSHLTWFKVGGEADIFFKPKTIISLSDFLHKYNDVIPIAIIGVGSNVIIRDGGVEGALIKLGRNFTDIQILDNNTLSVGSGCLNYNLGKFCLANGIAGFEFLIGIPGTIGGGIAMNAGAYGREFKDITIAIEALESKGKLIKLSTEEIGFKHRSNSLPDNYIITKAILKINKGHKEQIDILMKQIQAKRSKTQPINELTSGSTFVNPSEQKAWRLIDEAGLRGYKIGGASMSELHCNFMINDGSASAKDLETLGEFVKDKVYKQSGTILKWEIKRFGRNE